MTPTSEDGELTLSTIAPLRFGLSGVARAAFRRSCHSTTSNCTSTPQASFRFCWHNLFLRQGQHLPGARGRNHGLEDKRLVRRIAGLSEHLFAFGGIELVAVFRRAEIGVIDLEPT